MHLETDGPILSQGDSKRDKLRILLTRIIFIFFILYSIGYYLMVVAMPVQNEIVEEQDQGVHLPTIVEELSDEITKEEIVEAVEEELAEPEIQSADFYYKRALEREKNKDYTGAVEDYTQTIALAKKYSSEMWNSLNNRGIIKAKKQNNYNGAIADFNRIIDIETNRYDGNINATRLEAGYTNRAYVKKLKGDKQGACDDLYEALSLGVESSVAFIEKQIEKNCY